MKRIYLLMALLVSISFNTFAQRSINLEVTMTSPTASETIERDKSFNIRAVIKNLGPDSLKMTDSTLWYVTLSGSPISFTFGSQTGPYWLRYNRSLKVGDTMQMNFDNRVLNYKQGVDSNRTMCFNALPRWNGGGNDTINDPTLSNNSSCVTLKFKYGWPASVEELLITEAGKNAAAVYPNPASTQTNVAIKMEVKADVTVKVMDLTGRVVLANPTTNLEKGQHTMSLDVSRLQTGVYIYQVIMGNDVSSGKLSIAK
ncbi:MAG: T9SS type A sorting domain-containing protein [Chitinophagales bacterium]|nr:T9SS type A sorting domain-containing protein [Chitinophagaceae bacterium]MCB9063645.1 T9SS type A sorting domain-containing protein [Chitinophagales bacterium]